jgi:hypothetical protein
MTTEHSKNVPLHDNEAADSTMNTSHRPRSMSVRSAAVVAAQHKNKKLKHENEKLKHEQHELRRLLQIWATSSAAPLTGEVLPSPSPTVSIKTDISSSSSKQKGKYCEICDKWCTNMSKHKSTAKHKRKEEIERQNQNQIATNIYLATNNLPSNFEDPNTMGNREYEGYGLV